MWRYRKCNDHDAPALLSPVIPTHDTMSEWFSSFAPKAKWWTDIVSKGLMLEADFGNGIRFSGIVGPHTQEELLLLVAWAGTKSLGG
jgi:hypothetical protein